MTHLGPSPTVQAIPPALFDPDPLLTCRDCDALFRWSSSVDETRCDHCATLHSIDLGEVRS